MLSIDDVVPQVWVPHEETDTAFLIRPLEPKDTQRLMKEATVKKSGEFDAVLYNGLCAQHMIVDWKGIGEKGVASDCTPEATMRFGRRFGRIVAFLTEKATDPKMWSDEVDAGKNA